MQNSHKIPSIIIRTEYRDELILRPIPPTSRIRYSQVSSIGQMASPLANWGNGVKMEVPSKRKRTHLPNSGAGIRQPSRTFYQNPKFPLSVHTSPQPPLCMFSGYPFSSAQCLWSKRFFFMDGRGNQVAASPIPLLWYPQAIYSSLLLRLGTLFPRRPFSQFLNTTCKKLFTCVSHP